ncbi:MAG TPA: hypothetical protein VF771_12935 [Longimicrobiaceae bacterium]
MFALLTLPRGVPMDPEAHPGAGDRHDAEPPAGIIIRPGPAPRRVRLRDALSGARGAIAA